MVHGPKTKTKQLFNRYVDGLNTWAPQDRMFYINRQRQEPKRVMPITIHVTRQERKAIQKEEHGYLDPPFLALTDTKADRNQYVQILKMPQVN